MQGFWNWWLRLTAPGSSCFGTRIAEQEKLQRSQVLSGLLLLIPIAVIVGVPSALIRPKEWIPAAIIIVLGCAIAWLNRRGKGMAAGLLYIAAVDIPLTSVLLLQVRGITNSNIPDFDLFVFTVFITGLVLPRRFLFPIALSQLLIIGILFGVLPHDQLLSQEIQRHYDGLSFLVLRDAGLLLMAGAAIAWLGSLSVHRALVRADRADELNRMVQRQQQLLEEIHQLYQEQAHMAETDALTQVLNRRAIIDRLAEAVELCSHVQRPCALLFVDLDHFKRINDGWGHRAGDQVLVEACRRLRSVLSRDDLIGRYGGEEFAVLLKETDLSSAVQVAERAHQALSLIPHTWIVEDPQIDVRLVVTASIGVAVYGLHGTTTEVLLEKADQAMYQAKHRGRNCVVLADVDGADTTVQEEGICEQIKRRSPEEIAAVQDLTLEKALDI